MRARVCVRYMSITAVYSIHWCLSGFLPGLFPKVLLLIFYYSSLGEHIRVILFGRRECTRLALADNMKQISKAGVPVYVPMLADVLCFLPLIPAILVDVHAFNLPFALRFSFAFS